MSTLRQEIAKDRIATNMARERAKVLTRLRQLGGVGTQTAMSHPIDEIFTWWPDRDALKSLVKDGLLIRVTLAGHSVYRISDVGEAYLAENPL